MFTVLTLSFFNWRLQADFAAVGYRAGLSVPTTTTTTTITTTTTTNDNDNIDCNTNHNNDNNDAHHNNTDSGSLRQF